MGWWERSSPNPRANDELGERGWFEVACTEEEIDERVAV